MDDALSFLSSTPDIDDNTDHLFNVIKELTEQLNDTSNEECEIAEAVSLFFLLWSPRSVIHKAGIHIYLILQLTDEEPEIEVVGSTSENLESIKEFIKFDHEYIKKESNEPVICQEEHFTAPNVSQMEDTEISIDDDIIIVLDSSEVEISPEVHVTESYTDGENDNKIMQNEFSAFHGSVCSPISSDGGYESSVSLIDSPFNISPISPLSDGSLYPDDLLEDSFSELFPSLV